jgi:hypothetical protein
LAFILNSARLLPRSRRRSVQEYRASSESMLFPIKLLGCAFDASIADMLGGGVGWRWASPDSLVRRHRNDFARRLCVP